jgi:putative Mn2+ efflux pump MntP
MPTLEIVFIALALSIDAFAVALAASATGRVNNPRAAFRLSFHFGLFQFLMPVLGWAAGATLEPLIESFDHWVAFVLLGVVGIRMIRSSRNPNQPAQQDDPSRGIPLLTLSTAVSIDALAVGLSLAMLQISIWTPSAIIGLVTGAATVVGITLGARLHSRLGRIAELIGGIILILIAIRIVFIHTLSY